MTMTETDLMGFPDGGIGSVRRVCRECVVSSPQTVDIGNDCS